MKGFVVRDGATLADTRHDYMTMAEDAVAAAIYGRTTGKLDGDPLYVWDHDANKYVVTQAQIEERLHPSGQEHSNGAAGN